jgi:hypothetical protein
MDTNKDTKTTFTPNGPIHSPKDRQSLQLPSSVDDYEPESSKTAETGQSRNDEKVDEKLPPYEKATNPCLSRSRRTSLGLQSQNEIADDQWKEDGKAKKKTAESHTSIDTVAIADQKLQHDFQKTTLTDGPNYDLEDHQPQPLPPSFDNKRLSSIRRASLGLQSQNEIADDRFKQDGNAKKQTADSHSSIDTVAITDETLQQDFQKIVSNGPNYYLEDHQDPPSLEQEWVSPRRVSLGLESQNDKADDQLKQDGKAKKKTAESHCTDALAMTDEKFTKGGARAQRQDNRRDRIVSRKPTELPLTDDELKKRETRVQRQENRWGRILSRMSPDDTKPPSVSTSQEVKQDHEDEDEENATPGAVRIPGMNSGDSTGVEEDKIIMVEDGTNQEKSALMTLEAQLVVEEDTERVAQQEREQIEEETRQKILGEIGQVTHAEVVEDDGTKSRRRALLCVGIMVILLAIIIGSVLATRDTSPNTVSVAETMTPTISSVPSPSPSMKPSLLNNSLCEEPLPTILGDDGVEGSLQSAIEQVVVFCEFPDQPSDIQPGLWYNVREVGGV